MNEELKNTQDMADNEEVKPEAEQQDQANTTEDQAQTEVEKDAETLDEAVEIIANLQLKLRDAREAMEEQNAQVLRLQADFVNFRKRKEKESVDTIRFANQDLLRQLLPVLDNFERTLDAIEKTDNLTAIKEGIALVGNSMQKTLQKIGLEPIESTGKEFDSEIHEAVTSVPAPDESQQGKVIDTIEKGYKLKDRVIRFSKVVVGE